MSEKMREYQDLLRQLQELQQAWQDQTLFEKIKYGSQAEFELKKIDPQLKKLLDSFR
jgi:hypothetical protein